MTHVAIHAAMVRLPIHLWEVGRFKTKICKNAWKCHEKGWQRWGTASHHCQPFSWHFQHARAAARPFMHRYVIFSQNAPSSQPAMRALAGWPIACIHPASQPRACIMHEDSGCTQIRSWMAGWMDGWKSPNVQSFGIKIWPYWSRSPLGICNRPVWRLYI